MTYALYRYERLDAIQGTTAVLDQTSNRGGIATSSSRSEQVQPKLKKQPVRKSRDIKPATPKQPIKSFTEEDAVSWLEERVSEDRSTIHAKRRPRPNSQTPQRGASHGQDADRAVVCLVKNILASKQVSEVLSQRLVSKAELHRLLAKLVGLRREKEAMLVLEWIIQQPDYAEERVQYYSSLMVLLSQSSLGVNKALHLHESMQGQAAPLDLIAYNIAINAAGKAKHWDQTQTIFQSMLSTGLRPDVFTYTSLIKACQSCGNRWKAALEYLERMKSEGVKPNVTTYTTLVSCCQRAGKWAQAMGLFQEMEEAGVRADVKAYNSVISSCARAARWEHAWEICSSMRRAGCEPNIRTYNALISACERARQPQRALEAYRKLQRASGGGRSLEPTLVTYNTLISACGKGGLYQTALQLYEEMQSQGIAPDVFTLAALIRACKESNYWEDALQLAEEFAHSHGIKLNSVACNALITTLGRAGRWQYALQYFNQLVNGELDGQADSWSYTAMILSYRKAEKYHMVLDMYDDMHQARLPVYRDVYFGVLEACERLGLWQLGREVLQQMQEDASIRHLPSSKGLDMAAWQAVFAFPPLMESVPKSFISAARAAVVSGKKARLLVSSRQKDRGDEDSEEDD